MASTTDAAHEPLLRSDDSERLSRPLVPPPAIERRLYLSHALSTWNSRVFEFGAVLYLAAIFPGTLLPLSLYALIRGVSAIILAPSIGAFVDTGNRLRVVRVSIVFQRLAVAASCAVFYVLRTGLPLTALGRTGMLVLLTCLASVEKLCSIMNLVAIERDWVVVVTKSQPDALKAMNARMRRIDLLCKLLGPLFIALIDGYSTDAAILVNFAMNTASVLVEYYAIAWVYRDVPALQQPKAQTVASTSVSETEPSRRPSRFRIICRQFASVVNRSRRDSAMYLHHNAFLPSIAGAVLYLTVLSFAGQMVTYFISAGFNSTVIALARTVSVVFEVLATWAAPWLMGRIGPVRAGLWWSSWQFGTLAGGFAVFLAFESQPFLSAAGLVTGTILSRLGLRGFELCVQLIVQEEVEAESRGAFSSIEASWQNAFELLAYVSTVIFSRPDQFKWPSFISCLAVAAASSSYAAFVYIRRGHLLHVEKLAEILCSSRGMQWERERGIQRITRPDL